MYTKFTQPIFDELGKTAVKILDAFHKSSPLDLVNPRSDFHQARMSFDDVKSAFLSNLAKTVGSESGVLTNQDISRISPLVPDPSTMLIFPDRAIQNLEAIEAIVTDRLGKRVEIFGDLKAKLQKTGTTDAKKAEDAIKRMEKAP